MLTINS